LTDFSGEDDRLRGLLLTLTPKSPDDLRRVLIRDQADRDAIAIPCPATRPAVGGNMPGMHEQFSLTFDVRDESRPDTEREAIGYTRRWAAFVGVDLPWTWSPGSRRIRPT
jgi:hypothetical protein